MISINDDVYYYSIYLFMMMYTTSLSIDDFYNTYLHGYNVQLVVIDKCQVVCDDLVDRSVGFLCRG